MGFYHTVRKENKPVAKGGTSKSIKPRLKNFVGCSMNWIPAVESSNDIWSDGTNEYYGTCLVFDDTTKTWMPTSKAWQDAKLMGGYFWSDGENFYYSYNATQKVLNKETDTWENITWNGVTNLTGYYIWTDGTDCYYTQGGSGSTHKVLNKETNTWEAVTFSGLASFSVSNIWTDGTDTYFSNSSTQKVLDKETKTWENMTWKGMTSFYGQYIWSDGENFYYSSGSTHKVLDKETNTWENITWTYIHRPSSGYNISGSSIKKLGNDCYYIANNIIWRIDIETHTIDYAVFKESPYANVLLVGTTGFNNIWYSPDMRLDSASFGLTCIDGVWEFINTSMAQFLGKSAIWYDGVTVRHWDNNNRRHKLQDSRWISESWDSGSDSRDIWNDGHKFRKSDKIVDISNHKQVPFFENVKLNGLYDNVCDIFSDGDNYLIYIDCIPHIVDFNTEQFIRTDYSTFSALTKNYGRNIWSDGETIYYSSGPTQYSLDKETHVWTRMTWQGLTSFYGGDVWSDGENTYYSNSSTQKVLNRDNHTWSDMSWSGMTSFGGGSVWIDGENTYYSNLSTHKVLNKETHTWENITWQGMTSFYGSYIWSDGENIYYSGGSTQKVLDRANHAWEDMSWQGMTSFYGNNVFCDGGNRISYDNSTNSWVIYKNNAWVGFNPQGTTTSITKTYTWSDSNTIKTYHSSYGAMKFSFRENAWVKDTSPATSSGVSVYEFGNSIIRIGTDGKLYRKAISGEFKTISTPLLVKIEQTTLITDGTRILAITSAYTSGGYIYKSYRLSDTPCSCRCR